MAESAGFLARLLSDLAGEIGARIELHDSFGRYGAITYANGKTARFKGTGFDLNPMAAFKISDDKDYTAKLLASIGLRAAEGRVVVSPSYREKLASFSAEVAQAWDPYGDANAAFDAFRFPLFIKPNIGSEGIGVKMVADEQTARAHLDDLFKRCDTVLIQPSIKGRDFRLVMLNGVLRLAYERVPLSVTGDGQRTVGTLLEARLGALARQGRYFNRHALMPAVLEKAASQGLALDDIVEDGTNVALLTNANLSAGGSALDVTDEVAPEYVEICQLALERIGLRYAGLDILAADIRHFDEGHTILEINASPGLQNFHAECPAQRDGIRALYRDVLLAMQ